MTIYSYTKIWKIEKKIYSIGNVRLPIPLQPMDIIYTLLSIAGVVILQKLIPALTLIAPVIRYVVIPYTFVKLMTVIKLDGKNPVMFLQGAVRYLIFEKGHVFERFQLKRVSQEKQRIEWKIGCGRQAS